MLTAEAAAANQAGPRTNAFDWRREATLLVVVACGLLALWECVPGFRPKELGDFARALATPRGLGVLMQFVAYALFWPAAYRLRRAGSVRTVTAGLFAQFGLLLAVDFVFGVFLGSPALSLWMQRLTLLALILFGAADQERLGALARSVRSWPGWFWQGLASRWRQAFAVLVFFFFARQELHLFLTRGSPAGDETFFWYTASERLLQEGLLACLQHHDYVPGVPWLASLPARLFFSVDPEWLYGYSFMIMLLFAGLMVELAASAGAFLASSTVLFFVFLSSRDLHDLFGAKFYGEALAALLTATLMAEVYLNWRGGRGSAESRRVERPRVAPGRVIGWGLFLSYCAVARPGIGELALATGVAGAVRWAVVLKRWPERAWKPLLAVGLTFSNYEAWKLGLRLVHQSPIYKHLTLWGFLTAGADFSIPYRMLQGLFAPHSFQAAYAWGLVVALGLVLIQRRKLRLFAVMVGTVALYWGFTFVLYATLWKDMEKGSAGRYLSHAAVACVLLLPLAFERDDELFQ